jgi:hypothetical protein
MTSAGSEICDGPQFLGIGAPRCGTTWLHRMLSQHPQVWLPPIKEVHYFDSLDPALRTPARIDTLGGRLKKRLRTRLAHYAAAAVGAMAPPLAHRARVDWDWDRRYFSAGGSVAWYRELFNAKRASFRMVGEITPAYFALSDEVIATIRRETEVRKFILLLRDPIDAVWSGYGKRVRDGQVAIDPTNHDAVVGDLLTSGLSRRLYASNLKRWLAAFDRSCFFVGFFEDLNEAPGMLLDQVCEFLGVERQSQALGAQTSQRVNSSAASRAELPLPVERRLAERLEPELRDLAQLVGGRAFDWHRRAVRALSG